MDGKRLDRVINARKEYERMLDKVKELESIAEKITTTLSSQPKGGGTNLKDDTWAKLIDQKIECEWLIGIFLDESKELNAELDCITNPNIRLAMKYYYIDGLTQEAIASRMGCSDRGIRKMLQTGRRIYYEYYGDEEEIAYGTNA